MTWTGSWSVVSSRRDRAPVLSQGGIAELCADLLDGSATSTKDGRAIIGATFAAGGRDKAHAQAATLLCFDIDHADSGAMGRAKAALDGLLTICHETFSSTPEAQRFRLWVPLEKPASLTDHRPLWDSVARALRSVDVTPDTAAHDAVRLGYTCRNGAMPQVWAGSPLPIGVPQGQRNTTLTTLAGRLRRAGASPETILAELRAVNSSCSPPLGEGELETIARSMGRYDPAAPSDRDALPEIPLTTDLTSVVDASIVALATRGGVYQRAEKIVDVARLPRTDAGISRPVGAAIVRALCVHAAREVMTSAARYTRFDGRMKKVTESLPPDQVVQALRARRVYRGLPALRGIVTTPYCREDGTVHNEPGYDAGTGLYLDTTLRIELPERLTQDDARAAVEELADVVRDFPWVDTSHIVAWLAGLLTVLYRPIIAGPVPALVIDATAPGSGKTKLSEIISLIATGLPAPRTPPTTDDEEIRKSLMAVALGGDQILLLDNVRGRIGSPSLCAAVTSSMISDRVLGKSEKPTVPWVATVLINGNNVTLYDDFSRRFLYARLEPACERPELRAGFAHADLEGWVSKNRAGLVRAALVIYSAYCQAGKPGAGLAPFGSFESWQGAVAAPLAWATGIDPCASRAAITNVDSTADDGADLVMALWEWQGDKRWPASALLTAPAKVRDAVTSIWNGKNAPTAKGLAQILSRIRGRVYGNVSLSLHASTRQWFVAHQK